MPERALEVFRFLVVGGSFSLLYAVVTAASIRFLNTPPFVTSVIVYLGCIPMAYYAQKRFAFRAKNTDRSAIWIYSAVQLTNMVIVSTVNSQLTTRNFVYDTVIFLLAAGATAVASFLICRHIIFKS